MKHIIPAFFLFMLAFVPNVYALEEDAATMEKPSPVTTYAVAYHADWCGSCKILAPKISEMKEKLPEQLSEKVEFVKFDFTDEDTKETSKTSAEERGLSELYFNDSRTGQLKLVDKETGAVLGTINKDLSVEEMKGAVVAIASR